MPGNRSPYGAPGPTFRPAVTRDWRGLSHAADKMAQGASSARWRQLRYKATDRRT